MELHFFSFFLVLTTFTCTLPIAMMSGYVCALSIEGIAEKEDHRFFVSFRCSIPRTCLLRLLLVRSSVGVCDDVV